MAELKDSGNRREFETGAVRDMQEGKGRMDLVPWGVALSIKEAMGDLFYIRHYGYEVRNGKYQAVSAYQCIGPIVEYAEWMDKELNDTEAVCGCHPNPIDRLQEIENTFVKMAATFIMFQQVTPDPINRLQEIENTFVRMAAAPIMFQQMTPDPMNGQNGFNHQSFSFDDKGAVTTLLNDEWANAMLEVAKHYEDGARKYSENNWRKGIDPKIYFDSAMRHFMRWCRRMTDEPHNRAFIWNCMCGAWEAQQERHKIAYNTAKAESANVAEQAIPDSMNVLQSSRGWDPKPIEG